MIPREKKEVMAEPGPLCFSTLARSTRRGRPTPCSVAQARDMLPGGGRKSAVPTRERAAFLLRDQASYCTAMGSPLYARLLERAADDAAAGGPVFALVEPFDAPNL